MQDEMEILFYNNTYITFCSLSQRVAGPFIIAKRILKTAPDLKDDLTRKVVN